MVNKGIEAIVNFDVIRSNDFNLSLSVNFATLHNEVTKLAKDGSGKDIVISTGTRKTEVGHQINEWYLKEWAGVNPDNGMPQWYLNKTDENGNIADPNAKTEDYNAATRVYTGKGAIPTYSGGGGIHVDFKGLYFDANVYVAGGHQVFEDWTGYFWDNGRYATDAYQGAAFLMERWQKPGDITNVPKIQHSYRPQNSVSSSTRQLLKGDYLRLKDLVFGYKLPTSLLSHLKVSGATIYCRGTNLFTYAFDEETRKGFDPETGVDGFTGLETPPIKSISFGVNLNF